MCDAITFEKGKEVPAQKYKISQWLFAVSGGFDKDPPSASGLIKPLAGSENKGG